MGNKRVSNKSESRLNDKNRMSLNPAEVIIVEVEASEEVKKNIDRGIITNMSVSRFDRYELINDIRYVNGLPPRK